MWHMVCSCNQSCAEVGVEPVTRIYPIVGISHSVAVQGGRMWKAFLNNLNTIYKSASYFFFKILLYLGSIAPGWEGLCAHCQASHGMPLASHSEAQWDISSKYMGLNYLIHSVYLEILDIANHVIFRFRTCLIQPEAVPRQARKLDVLSLQWHCRTKPYKCIQRWWARYEISMCLHRVMYRIFFFWDFSPQNSTCLQGCLQPCSNSEKRSTVESNFGFHRNVAPRWDFVVWGSWEKWADTILVVFNRSERPCLGRWNLGVVPRWEADCKPGLTSTAKPTWFHTAVASGNMRDKREVVVGGWMEQERCKNRIALHPLAGPTSVQILWTQEGRFRRWKRHNLVDPCKSGRCHRPM